MSYVPSGASIGYVGSRPSVVQAFLPYGSTLESIEDISNLDSKMSSNNNGKLEAHYDLFIVDVDTEVSSSATSALPRLRQYGLPVLLISEQSKPLHAKASESCRLMSRHELMHSIEQANFCVADSLVSGEEIEVFRLLPERRSTIRSPRVLILSFYRAKNFGDRLGYYLTQRVLPQHVEIHHAYFDPSSGYLPSDVPDLKFDMLMLGIGNSLFDEVLTEELIDLMDKMPRTIGIFGTQYRERLRISKFIPVLERLDQW